MTRGSPYAPRVAAVFSNRRAATFAVIGLSASTPERARLTARAGRIRAVRAVVSSTKTVRCRRAARAVHLGCTGAFRRFTAIRDPAVAVVKSARDR